MCKCQCIFLIISKWPIVLLILRFSALACLHFRKVGDQVTRANKRASNSRSFSFYFIVFPCIMLARLQVFFFIFFTVGPDLPQFTYCFSLSEQCKYFLLRMHVCHSCWPLEHIRCQSTRYFWRAAFQNYFLGLYPLSNIPYLQIKILLFFILWKERMLCHKIMPPWFTSII